MNTPNPLVPQGSLQGLKNKKTNVSIAFFTILAVHVVLLGVLLMQGCKREDATLAGGGDLMTNLPPASADTNLLPTGAMDTTSAPPTEVVMPTTTVPVDPYATNPTGTLPPPVDVGFTPPTTPPPVAPAARTYTVAKGDSFYAISRKTGISVNAIKAANPGVDPAKLQIGKKLNLPETSSSTLTPTPAAVDMSATGETSYTVKSGDNLIKIGKQFGTTPAAIRSLNNLPTTNIRVGQKLRIPTKAAPPVSTPAPVEMTPPPMSTPSPMTVPFTPPSAGPSAPR